MQRCFYLGRPDCQLFFRILLLVAGQVQLFAGDLQHQNASIADLRDRSWHFLGTCPNKNENESGAGGVGIPDRIWGRSCQNGRKISGSDRKTSESCQKQSKIAGSDTKCGKSCQEPPTERPGVFNSYLLKNSAKKIWGIEEKTFTFAKRYESDEQSSQILYVI